MDDGNELRRIRGIGAARAGWLQETFGVRSLADLAALDPDEICRRLAESGRGAVARDAVASWVATARELASGGTHEVTGASGAGAGDELEGDAWRPRASFVVEFQSMAGGGGGAVWRTAAHHVERDGDEEWPGIDCDGLSRWMTGHLVAIGAVEPAGGDLVEASPDTLPSIAPAEGERPEEPMVELRARVVDGDGYRGARLVRIDTPWAVDLCWNQGEAPDLAGPGKWRIDLALWPIGESAPLELPGMVVPSLGEGERGRHQHRMEIQTGLVTAAHCGAPYRATATLTFHRAGDQSAAIAGAVDLGFVRFYDPSRSRRGGRELPATSATGGGP